MIVRTETKEDYTAVYNVVKTAFASAEQSDGTEQELVTALRKSTAFVPELSLVAEMDGDIVGHIMFTKIDIGKSIELALAPLSVLPQYQKRGVGTALIIQGHKLAKSLGYAYSVVLGSNEYYAKSGYVPAGVFGIEPPFDVPYENFMAYKLRADAPKVHGTVKYAEEFAIN